MDETDEMTKPKAARRKKRCPTRTKRRSDLPLNAIHKLSEAEAYETLKLIRFAETGGKPVCPFCSCNRISDIPSRQRFKCRECKQTFSLTSGTVWSHSKMSFQKLLLMAAYFSKPKTGTATTTLCGLIGFSEMNTHVALHKIREAIGIAHSKLELEGICEADGAKFGGYTRNPNDRSIKNYRRNDHLIQVMGVAIERRGRAVTSVARFEKDHVPFIGKAVRKCKRLHLDEGSHWEPLRNTLTVRTIAHKYHFSTQWLKGEDGKWVKQKNGACTNQAESFFARMRKAERMHTHIAGAYLDLYGHEQAWRHNCRFLTDAERYLLIIKMCLSQPVSRRFKGHRQTRRSDGQERGSQRAATKAKRD